MKVAQPSVWSQCSNFNFEKKHVWLAACTIYLYSRFVTLLNCQRRSTAKAFGETLSSALHLPVFSAVEGYTKAAALDSQDSKKAIREWLWQKGRLIAKTSVKRVSYRLLMWEPLKLCSFFSTAKEDGVWNSSTTLIRCSFGNGKLWGEATLSVYEIMLAWRVGGPNEFYLASKLLWKQIWFHPNSPAKPPVASISLCTSGPRILHSPMHLQHDRPAGHENIFEKKKETFPSCPEVQGGTKEVSTHSVHQLSQLPTYLKHRKKKKLLSLRCHPRNRPASCLAEHLKCFYNPKLGGIFWSFQNSSKLIHQVSPSRILLMCAYLATSEPPDLAASQLPPIWSPFEAPSRVAQLFQDLMKKQPNSDGWISCRCFRPEW